MRKCPDCPVPADLDCPREILGHKPFCELFTADPDRWGPWLLAYARAVRGLGDPPPGFAMNHGVLASIATAAADDAVPVEPPSLAPEAPLPPCPHRGGTPPGKCPRWFLCNAKRTAVTRETCDVCDLVEVEPATSSPVPALPR